MARGLLSSAADAVIATLGRPLMGHSSRCSIEALVLGVHVRTTAGAAAVVVVVVLDETVAVVLDVSAVAESEILQLLPQVGPLLLFLLLPVDDKMNW